LITPWFGAGRHDALNVPVLARSAPLGAKPPVPAPSSPPAKQLGDLDDPGFSALTRSSNLQLRELQEQFENLLSGRTASHADKGAAAPMMLLRQLPLDVPLMMQIGTLIVRLLRPSSDSGKGEQAGKLFSKAGRKRRGVVRPVLAVVATLGAAYAASRILSRPATGARQPARPAAASATPRRTGRLRVRVT